MVERGPWEASEDGSTIVSDDFTHDVILCVTGDFAGGAQRKAYANEIARRLNITYNGQLSGADVHLQQNDGQVFGCYCDLEDDMEPDGCVIDDGRVSDCIFAVRLQKDGKGRNDCKEWRPVTFRLKQDSRDDGNTENTT